MRMFRFSREPEHQEITVMAETREEAIEKFLEKGGWFCAEWPDNEPADFVDLWAPIPPIDCAVNEEGSRE